MKISLYFNQYTNGGSIDREKWELFSAPKLKYGSCETLKVVTVDLPEGWSVEESAFGEKRIYDSTDYEVKLESDYFAIYAITAEPPCGKRIRLKESE